jgi:uncharacterized protein YkwD
MLIRVPIVLLTLTLLPSCRMDGPVRTGEADRSAARRDSAQLTATELEQEIFENVNAVREKNGLPQLEWNPDLLAAAREHSRRMVELDFVSHDDPEHGSAGERLRREGIGWIAVGENIFVMRGVGNPAAKAVEGWLNSPGHREVMLTRDFRNSAVGVHRRGDGTLYGTQLFTRAPRDLFR